ncbi:hypothetical protein T439DRAFT_352392 [Meredithblackwellia eburnea MCA 4105]
MPATTHVVEASSPATKSWSDKTWAERLQVSPPDDAKYTNNRLINPDIVPMGPERRTWGIEHFSLWWFVGGFSVVNYSSGSALIAYGLSGPQAIGCNIFGSVILGLTCVTMGWWGSTHHIGYMGVQRLSWGINGSMFPVALRCVPGIIWDGIEGLWGGFGFSVALGALSPRFAHWDATLANGNLYTRDFIGFVIYYLVFLATMMLKPEKLAKPFIVTTVGFTLLVFGLLIWAVHNNGGPGSYFATDYKSTQIATGNIGWAWVFGAMAVLSNFAGATIGQSDWTRFSRKGMAPTYAQLIACPVSIILSSTIGVIVTSCAKDILGTAVWQPYQLLSAIQAHYNDSPRVRAAVFFGGLAASAAQVNANIVLNSVSMGMDMAALVPKYINIRRASYIIAILGACTNPWYLTASAGTFLTVLSGFGIFYGVLMGIMMANFFIISKRRIKLHDLYLGTPESIYYYEWKGVNLRTVGVFCISLVPSFPGYIKTIQGKDYDAWRKISSFTILLGMAISVILCLAVNYFFPYKHSGEGELYHDDETFFLPGEKTSSSIAYSEDGEKADANSIEKQAPTSIKSHGEVDASWSDVYGVSGGPVAFRLGNGGAGPIGLLRHLANRFVSSHAAGRSVPWVCNHSRNTQIALHQDYIDVAMTYEREWELVSVKEGWAVDAGLCFHDHFVVVGPLSNPANLLPGSQCLRKIAASKSTFHSRADGSATMVKERDLWSHVGVSPWEAKPDWYTMATLTSADALVGADGAGAYLLSDRSTVLRQTELGTIRNSTVFYEPTTPDASS